MKNLCKIAILSICILLIPFSASYSQEETTTTTTQEETTTTTTQEETTTTTTQEGTTTTSISASIFTPLDGLVYYLYVKGHASIWTPTFEFKAGNILKVIGTSSDYGQLEGVWQEAPLGFFSFFWAQVESDEPAETTTTIPDDPTDLLTQSVQPQQTEQTNFLINLWGLSFPANPFVPIRLIIGGGDYLKASGAVYIGLAAGVVDATFGSISPSSIPLEAQNQTYPMVITGLNTKFQDPGDLIVQFSPSDGLVVSNPVAKSDIRLEFNLEVLTTATVGLKNVTVSYGTPSISVTGNSVFEITE